MPDEPQSIIERQPPVRGQRLAVLIFLLWLPLALIAVGISVLVEFSIPLIGVFVIGTILSLGLAIAALRAT